MLKKDLPLQAKYSLTLLGLTGVLLCLFIYIFSNISKDIAEEFSSNAQNQLSDTLVSKVREQGQITSQLLVAQLSQTNQINQLSSLQNLAKLVEKNQLSYAFIYDQNGHLIGPYQQQENLWPHNLPKLQYQSELVTNGIVNLFNPIPSPSSDSHTMLVIGFPISTAKETRLLHSNLERSLSDSSVQFLIQAITGTLIFTLLALAASYMITSHFIHPIRLLTNRSRRLGEGDLEVSLALERSDELGELSRSLQQMRNNLVDSYNDMSQLAWYDPLTGLYNREGCFHHSQLLLSEKAGAQASLTVINLDGFKRINDTMGYKEGDETLRTFAQRLTQLVRKYQQTALIARVSGDEFLLVVAQEQSEAISTQIARELLALSQQALNTKKSAHQLTMSIGISSRPRDGNDFDSLLKAASIAMHTAKYEGKNKYTHYIAGGNQNEWQPETLKKSLQLAIDKGELYVLYQGIFDPDNSMVGVEALVRWNHHKLGAVSPAQFIPIAEQFPVLIEDLTLYVLEQSCAAFEELLTDEQEDFKISINVAACLLNNPELAELLLFSLSEYHVKANRIILEITETQLLTDIDFCCQQLAKLKAAGFTLWIDDFGTGYSSLSYLHRLPVDGLKIDRSFIEQLDQSSAGHAFIKAIVELSKALAVETLAEGVETQAQHELLKSYGCHWFQGFYLHKPAYQTNVMAFHQHYKPKKLQCVPV
ncbi:EAL domain-containing protein [Motilimonas cestriensis]|uniref:EAL domain-containing protein n=1 Tax=Motilimonas cestriensis TaxID=2742685 RepID=A0ABS8WC53_9GAMM|nr:bifunctional diguanylate cyclase/phosphodiesterase [Motilimonas cestriensis]MCE2596128.1 EAL domain-containing protein [Motilimonas cestriensis]